jgi:hypothetical protein
MIPKKTVGVVYIYILYTPRTILHPLFFSFGKGSEAALIGHVTEHRGTPGRARVSVEGASAEYGGAPGEHARALGEPQEPVQASRGQFVPRPQLPVVTLIRFN